MKRLIISLLVATTFSCEKIDSPILGKWQYIVDIGQIHMETTRIMTFGSDGTATFGIPNDLTHYTYDIDGNKLTMHIVDGETLNYIWGIDSEGILNISQNGGTLRFKRY